MTIIIIYIIIHLVCGVLAAGGVFSYLQREWPCIAAGNRCSDLMVAYGIGLVFGPVALISAVMVFKKFKHGFKFW